MRRKDREITEKSEMLDILKRARVIRIAFSGDEYPYVLPFNYGVMTDGDKTVIYIHGAKDGKKNELIAKNAKVGFETDICYDYRKGSITSFYESVCGCGKMTVVEDYDEKRRALELILSQYAEKEYRLDNDCVDRTNVLRLDVAAMSGKKHE